MVIIKVMRVFLFGGRAWGFYNKAVIIFLIVITILQVTATAVDPDGTTVSTVTMDNRRVSWERVPLRFLQALYNPPILYNAVYATDGAGERASSTTSVMVLSAPLSA